MKFNHFNAKFRSKISIYLSDMSNGISHRKMSSPIPYSGPSVPPIGFDFKLLETGISAVYDWTIALWCSYI